MTTANGAATTVMLPEILDLGAAESLLDAVRQRMSEQGSLHLDASAVRTLTVPCIQIMLAATAGGGEISVENPSEAFTSAFADIGVPWPFGQGRPQNETSLVPDETQEPIAAQGGNIFDNAALQSAVDGAPQPEPAPIESQLISESVMSKRILTIDDSKTMRDMLMLTLAEAGFDVLQAVDGQDGLDVLAKEQVDVVITDINMPRMDGYEVIRQLRKNVDYRTKPILVLTTESEAEKRNLAREAGATGWMVKPFDPDRLVATVRKVAP